MAKTDEMDRMESTAKMALMEFLVLQVRESLSFLVSYVDILFIFLNV